MRVFIKEKLWDNDYLLILSTIIISISVMFISGNLNFNKLNFLDDLIIVIMLIKIFINVIMDTKKSKSIFVYLPVVILAVFIFSTGISFLVNDINMKNYLKGLFTDYIKYIIAYLGILTLRYTKEQFKFTLKILEIILLLQIPIVYIQDYITKRNWVPNGIDDIREDYLSGILGGRATSELGAYICIALVIYILLYLNKKISLLKLGVVSILFLSVVVIAEIKFVFILLPILFLVILITNLNKKTLKVFLVSICILVVGVFSLGKIYPWFNNFFSPKVITSYINTEYAGTGLTRADSIFKANEVLGKNNSKLLGLGISKADSLYNEESNNILTIKNEGRKYDFRIFTWAFYLVETGYIGFILVSLFFMVILFMSVKLFIKGDIKSKFMGIFGIDFVILSIFLNFHIMSYLKINFAILAWMTLGIITKCYYNNFNDLKVKICLDRLGE